MAAGGTGYWPTDYWHLEYWHVEYWPETSPPTVPQTPTGTRYRYGHRVHWVTQVLLLAALLFTVPSSADLFTAMGLGVCAAKAGDALSTELALQREGTAEANPLMQNRPVRLATSIAAPLLLNFATAKIHARNPRLALWLRIGAVVGWGYATAHNLRAGR